MNCMDEETIALFLEHLPTKHLRRSNENYVIIATSYLRAEFGRNCVDVQFTGSDKTSFSFDDFRNNIREIRRRVLGANLDHRMMANAIKERYVLMRPHFPKGFKTFALYGSDKNRLVLTIADSVTQDALAQLHVNDVFCEIFINMIGPHLDLHTGMRVAFNKSGNRK